jgi:hypothetical protein
MADVGSQEQSKLGGFMGTSNCFHTIWREIAAALFLVCALVAARQTVAQQVNEKSRPDSEPNRTQYAKESQVPEFTLDESLVQSLENHPEIVAAKARIALAEAELNAKRIEVAEKMIPLFERRIRLKKSMEELGASYKQAVAKADKASSDADAKKSAEAIRILLMQLSGTGADLARVELIIRQSNPTSAFPNKPASTPAGPQPHQAALTGTVAQKIKTALDKQTELHFVSTPLFDVLAYFTDSKGIKFSYNSAELKSVNEDPTSVVIDLELNVPFRSVLQAIEDDHPKLQFVVRDYGILLTTKKDAEERGFVPAVDFGKNSITPANFATTPKAYLQAKTLKEALVVAKDQLKRDGRAEYVDRLTEIKVRDAIKKAIENYEARIRERMKTDRNAMRELREFEEFRPIYRIIANDGAWPLGASWDIRYEFQFDGVKIKGIQPHLQIEVADEGRGFGLPIVELQSGEQSK